MIKRRMEEHLLSALKRSSTVTLMDPRQVGKTTLALNLNEENNWIYLDLENPLDLAKISDIIFFIGKIRTSLSFLMKFKKSPIYFPQLEVL